MIVRFAQKSISEYHVPLSRALIGKRCIDQLDNGSRKASSASSREWISRHNRDPFVRDSKIDDLKSRAAYKLVQIDERYGIFKPGQTVIDLVRCIAINDQSFA